MDDDHHHRAAEALLHARRSGEWLDPHAFGWSPASEADALAVQAATLAGLGDVGGWKVGAGAPDAPASLAPLPASGVRGGTGLVIPVEAHRLRGVEVEVAYRLSRDLAPRAAAYTEDEVAEAVGAVCLAVEVVESRFVDRDAAGALWALADLQSHGALLTGEMHADWRGRALDPVHVELEFGDRAVVDRLCSNAGGAPFGLVVRLANLAGHHCGGLKAGQVITTGSLMGVEFAPAGEPIRAAVRGLGAIRLEFAAA